MAGFEGGDGVARMRLSTRDEWAEDWVSKSLMDSCDGKMRNAASTRGWDEMGMQLKISVVTSIDHLEQRMY